MANLLLDRAAIRDLQRPGAVRWSRAGYDVIRTRTNRVGVHHASLIDFLTTQLAQSLHRFVLLDAQDSLTPEILEKPWTEIDCTAASADARVIFRTAGAESPLPRKLPAALLASWVYREEESLGLHRQDRSSIYGGFHLYVRRLFSWQPRRRASTET